MTKKIGVIYIVFGIFFIGYSLFLIIISDIKIDLALFFNLFLFLFDIVWLLGVSVYLIIIGLHLLKNEHMIRKKFLAGGHLIIFTINFLLASVVFTFLITNTTRTHGRPITYFVQALIHIVNPHTLLEFLISLGAFVSYVIFIILFQRIVKKKFV